jgi:hypothetical protein
MLNPDSLRSRCIDLVDNTRGQSKAWFVDEYQTRFAHEGATNDKHLLLSTRHLSTGLVQPFLQAGKILEHPFKVSFDGGSILAPERPDAQIFLHGQAGEHVPTLGHERKTGCGNRLWCVAGQIPTFENNAPRSNRVSTRDGAEGGGFSGAIPTYDGDESPRRNFK